jgi:hypothetical protein
MALPFLCTFLTVMIVPKIICEQGYVVKLLNRACDNQLMEET